MALDLNHHLLEAPDCLVAAVLGHLLAKVVLGALLRILFGLESSLLVFLGLVLVLIRHVLVCCLLQVVGCVRQASPTSLLRVIGRVVLSVVHSLLACLLNIALAEWLVLSILILCLGLESTGVQVWDVVPCVLWSRLVDLVEAVLIRIDSVCRLLGSITSHIAQEDTSIAEQFTELAIGENQCAECAKTVQGFVAVLLSSGFVGRRTWQLCVAAIQILCLPDEVLEQVALVLAQKQMLGLFDDIAEIGH